ncbi:MAG: hypothetical protein U0798_09260 [Gemmataceae bacterium]
MARLFRFETLCFLVLFTFLLLFGRERFFGDPGTFWHIKTGYLFLETGTLVKVDPFSHTFGGQPWTPQSWLAEIAMAALEKRGGIDSLLTVSIAIISFLFAALAGRLRQSGLHPVAVVLLGMLAVVTASNHFHVRPHLVTMVGMAGVMVAMSAVESGRTSIRSLWWFIPGFVFWVNTHGGVLGGVATVGLTFTLWLGMAALRWESPVKSWGSAMELSLIGVAILVTLLASPYGMDFPRTWLSIMGMPELKNYVKEHMPLDVTQLANTPFLIFGALYAFLLTGLREKPRATWLIPIVWFVLGCDRVRQISLFGIVAFVAIADIFPRTVYAQWLASKRPDYFVPTKLKPSLLAWVVPGLAVVACLALQFASISVPVFGRGWARYDPRIWAIELLPVIRSEAEGRIAEPIFNDFNDGGFLIWYAPEFRVFIDDRCEIYGGKLIKEYCDASRGGLETGKAYIEEQQRKYGPYQYALTQLDTGFEMYLQSDTEHWQCLGRSQNHAFYRRIQLDSSK